MAAGQASVRQIGWCCTAKEPDMAFSYRWTIEDFKSKMETFKLGQQLESSQFVINGFKLCINLYPNGRNEEEGGFVSLFLRNDNSFQLEVKCDFILGIQNSHKHTFCYNKINPNSGYGFPKMYSHEQIVSKSILDEDNLEILAVITFRGKVKNINMSLEQEEDTITETAKVGLDLFKAFESQEFCDFDIVCDDKIIKCHKVVLASRSPVFRAMLLHNMEESSSQKVEPKNFDFDTMYLVLKFMYKGEIEQPLLVKHAETIFKAADYYEIDDLKAACEKVLITQINIKNMLDMLVMADMYKAGELKSATKKLIVENSKELMKQKDWKLRFGSSQSLVFEREMSQGKLRFAVVCSSNMNRSMEAHNFLQKKGYNIQSYGTGNMIKIPGKSEREPNTYPFGTTYDFIFEDLKTKDQELYTKNGMLHIMERNRRIKSGPEKFQDCPKEFEIILTVEEKVYDQVLECFNSRDSVSETPVHVINMNVVDNPEDATIGAFLLCELAKTLTSSDDLDNDIDDIIQDFEGNCEREVLHTVLFY